MKTHSQKIVFLLAFSTFLTPFSYLRAAKISENLKGDFDYHTIIARHVPPQAGEDPSRPFEVPLSKLQVNDLDFTGGDRPVGNFRVTTYLGTYAQKDESGKVSTYYHMAHACMLTPLEDMVKEGNVRVMRYEIETTPADGTDFNILRSAPDSMQGQASYTSQLTMGFTVKAAVSQIGPAPVPSVEATYTLQSQHSNTVTIPDIRISNNNHDGTARWIFEVENQRVDPHETSVASKAGSQFYNQYFGVVEHPDGAPPLGNLTFNMKLKVILGIVSEPGCCGSRKPTMKVSSQTQYSGKLTVPIPQLHTAPRAWDRLKNALLRIGAPANSEGQAVWSSFAQNSHALSTAVPTLKYKKGLYRALLRAAPQNPTPDTDEVKETIEREIHKATPSFVITNMS